MWGYGMMSYIRIGKLCAFHTEWALAFTVYPLLSWHDCNGETIIDLPFCRVIFTPGHKLQAPFLTAEPDYNDEQQHYRLSAPPAGAAEN
jgi:hypothetical protein